MWRDANSNLTSVRCRAAIGATGLAALVAGCGGSSQLSLATLASNQTAYVGKDISTTGIVELQRSSNGTAYYVLADAAQDLVLLDPPARARLYQRKRVTVHGRFAFDLHQGRLIRIVSIHRS